VNSTRRAPACNTSPTWARLSLDEKQARRRAPGARQFRSGRAPAPASWSPRQARSRGARSGWSPSWSSRPPTASGRRRTGPRVKRALGGGHPYRYGRGRFDLVGSTLRSAQCRPVGLLSDRWSFAAAPRQTRCIPAGRERAQEGAASGPGAGPTPGPADRLMLKALRLRVSRDAEPSTGDYPADEPQPMFAGCLRASPSCWLHARGPHHDVTARAAARRSVRPVAEPATTRRLLPLRTGGFEEECRPSPPAPTR
jgi:hypothetical protein